MKNLKLRLTVSCLLCMLICITGCNKDVIRGSGNSGTRTLNLPTFTEVESHYDIEAIISYGITQEVTVTGYENLLNILDVKVENGVLKLKYNTAYNSIKNGNIVAQIKIPTINKTAIHGSENITVNGFLNGLNFEAFIHGSGNIYVNNCKFQSSKLQINGSGKIKAKGLETLQNEANIYGSGNIDVTVTNRIKASIYGSGSIYYWGNPLVEIYQYGSGRVVKQ